MTFEKYCTLTRQEQLKILNDAKKTQKEQIEKKALFKISNAHIEFLQKNLKK